MNAEKIIQQACHIADEPMPTGLSVIQEYVVLDTDSEPCGPLSEKEKLIAAYLLGQAAQKEGAENDKREDFIYARGLKAGWNMGLREDTERFNAAMKNHGRS